MSLRCRKMQAMLGSAIEKLRRRQRPFAVDQIRHFTLVKQSAEMTAEVAERSRFTEQPLGARAIESRVVQCELCRQPRPRGSGACEEGIEVVHVAARQRR